MKSQPKPRRQRRVVLAGRKRPAKGPRMQAPAPNPASQDASIEAARRMAVCQAWRGGVRGSLTFLERLRIMDSPQGERWRETMIHHHSVQLSRALLTMPPSTWDACIEPLRQRILEVLAWVDAGATPPPVAPAVPPAT